ncbi:hypothetical protein GLOTRDRAFT_129842 [Gloeophyllum trabeum ATCC 11539]|uniref:Methyltransferase domain-containing protein n=1 Tax=Gloeophyllum trabeum (strain ATCC 11539 / FP-39264 / Madison 617) TaxID=670483 RepID=S7RNY7_GLOTA|nr:uncharacterized protein GLOTRDRAFT_129842 [Gloeophyllum trabeum ATCC 11539]EPQ54479.1 hypothetical protein GLOTRDRAFT_129842 [Gloeophyllum trabeum ATCC 11539]
MPPQYHDQAFWNTRFKNEATFEWLGDGQDTLLPPLRDFLVQCRASFDVPPRILHIGAGTSSFQDHVQRALVQIYGNDVDCRTIVNTDFAEVPAMHKADTAQPSGQWVKADLLRWTDILKILETASDRFSVVLDKSTSDAISCGSPVAPQETSEDMGINPLVRSLLAANGSAEKNPTLSALEVLSLHLATCVKPGGIWIALSYSSDRFPFLRSSNSSSRQEHKKMSHSSIYWTIENVVAVDAPSGQDKPGVHAPRVQHHLYVLRRTSAAA